MFDLFKMGFKLLLFAALLAAVSTFTNLVLGLIPPLNLGGCMGYYAASLGVVDGFNIMISIVIYGYTVKFGLNFFSNYLN